MRQKIKLLISPKNIEEAKVAIDSNIDFIDCKNPSEGSLGANFPWIIKSMKKLIPENNHQLLSATIGDFPNLPGSASLAALGAAFSGADIIKVGLKGPKNQKEGIYLMKNVVKAVKEFNNNIKVVVAGYADYSRMEGALEYLKIPKIAAESGSDYVMLDTFIKDGKGLFDFLNVEQLTRFLKNAKSLKLNTALAGNLKIKDMQQVKSLAPDIIGVRTVVCEGYDRNKGMIKADLIEKLKDELYK